MGKQMAQKRVNRHSKYVLCTKQKCIKRLLCSVWITMEVKNVSTDMRNL